MAPALIPLLLLFITTLHAKIVQDKPNLVTEFKRDTGKGIFKKDFPHYAVLIQSRESEDFDDHFEEFEVTASKFEDKVKFVFIDTDVEKHWETIEYLGLIAEDVPAVLYIDLSHGIEKFKAELEEITRENIEKFVQDCMDGKLTAFFKSEDVPADWDSKPLKELVSKNFEQEVIEKKRTAFVMFYAEWCEACKKMMPEMEKLAKKFAKDKDIMIARMDSTSNELPKLPVLDVPTLALFVNGDRKPFYYTHDDRMAADFYKFINLKRDDSRSKTKVAKEEEEEEVTPEEKVDENKKSEKKVKKTGEKTETKKKTTKSGGKAKKDTKEENKKDTKSEEKETKEEGKEGKKKSTKKSEGTEKKATKGKKETKKGKSKKDEL